MIDENTVAFGRPVIANALSITAKDNFTRLCLAPVEVSGQALRAVVGQMGWCLRILLRGVVPV
jgi:hypothetical protein